MSSLTRVSFRTITNYHLVKIGYTDRLEDDCFGEDYDYYANYGTLMQIIFYDNGGKLIINPDFTKEAEDALSIIISYSTNQPQTPFKLSGSTFKIPEECASLLKGTILLNSEYNTTSYQVMKLCIGLDFCCPYSFDDPDYILNSNGDALMTIHKINSEWG